MAVPDIVGTIVVVGVKGQNFVDAPVLDGWDATVEGA
jgi:hypothetical protein